MAARTVMQIRHLRAAAHVKEDIMRAIVWLRVANDDLTAGDTLDAQDSIALCRRYLDSATDTLRRSRVRQPAKGAPPP